MWLYNTNRTVGKGCPEVGKTDFYQLNMFIAVLARKVRIKAVSVEWKW